MILTFEYIWVGGNRELRNKVKVLDKYVNSRKRKDLKYMLSILPEWNYDGSSTNQAPGNNSEIILKPVACYFNPFNNTDTPSYLVLCDTYYPDNNPHITNTRFNAVKIFDNDKFSLVELKPLFGLELEFFVIDTKTNHPLGFDSDGKPYNGPQGPYYCSVGTGKCYGRSFLDECLNNCIKASLPVTGSNMEVSCGQMEIQVCSNGISAGDNHLILKYILERTGEKYGYCIDFSAKPMKGNWNGSGCHVNYSTSIMRKENGLREIMNAIKKLSENHKQHIAVYGDDNIDRLTGSHETSSINEFTYGVSDREASIRIPTTTYNKKCGYFEDRRPSASADMYLVTSYIHKTCSNPLDVESRNNSNSILI